MSKALDWAIVIVCMVFALWCLVQSLRGVPVEPRWSWGVWAYLSGAGLAMQRIKEHGNG